MTAWIVRAGVAGERDAWALTRGVAGGGFHEVTDLSAAETREQVRNLVAAAFLNDQPGRINNFSGQMWALRHRIKPGDLIVLPLKTTKKLALGICTDGYVYRTDEDDQTRRHAITVNWKRTDVSRTAIKDDFLNTINGDMTIFEVSKNNAEKRLRSMLESGIDPGSTLGAAGGSTTSGTTNTSDLVGSIVDVADPTPAITLEALRDRIRAHLVENFGQHKLTHLIAEILRAQGYVCEVSPEGPDFGVDIIAGRGPLGLDSPTLVVEVKSEAGQVGAQVLNGLQGAIKTHRVDQGLLVAWGGLAKPAREALRTERLTVRVWDAEDVLDHLFTVYDRLPDELRAQVPLKRVWILIDETG